MKIDIGRNPQMRIAAALLASALASVMPTLADQVVYFVNGKAIMVKSIDRQGDLTFLEMEGGGRMGVPSEHIARVEDYAVSAPVIPAPPVAAQVPVQAPPPVVQTTGVPAPPQPALATQPSYASVARPPTGPGVAGQPSARAPLTPVNTPGPGFAGPAVGGPSSGALAGPGGPYRPGVGAQGRRFGKGTGPGGRLQRGTAQGGFRNRLATVTSPAPPNTPDPQADQEADDTDQNAADPDVAPTEDPDSDPGQADQGDSGS